MRRKNTVPAPAFSDLHLQVQLSQPSDYSSEPSQLQDLHRLIRNDLRPTTPTPNRSAAARFAFEDGKTNKPQTDGEKICNNFSFTEDDNGVRKLQIPLLPPVTESVGVTTPGRWCEGEKAMPLKKRKASLEMNGVVTNQREYTCKMNSMTNKNCPNEDDSSSEDSDAKNRRKKKKKGGGKVMEGSRCSRVNGRGWRCMQPTLVGYSLCEHHLGKGRLRSINKSTTTTRHVKRRPTAAHDEDEEEDDRKVVSRKRKRIGIVKARSLSSLLCQPNTAFRASST